ncbi:hypothetical protein EAY39_07845 [Vibrio anguillarum]|uniref:hypothetical protein n=1 Tax=Vibrio anguillarum TaxID=55601 RepID=UPI0018C26F7A|nr:hypothetical protein [Vibrio anguillarum]MBF4340699.1 hypothetical protein [Vibrio anguillarum]
MNENEAYAAIRKFVASGVFLLAYIYLVQHSQDRLMISGMGLGFIVCLIQGLRAVLIKKTTEEHSAKKVAYSKGEKVDS